MTEVVTAKKEKKKLKLKKKVVAKDENGDALTVRVKEERKKIDDEEIANRLQAYEISTDPISNKSSMNKAPKEESADNVDQKQEEPPKIECPARWKLKEKKKLKKIKDIVAEEVKEGETGKVFTTLDELRPTLEGFRNEQHLRRWMKKQLLCKRITKKLRNEACDEWMKKYKFAHIQRKSDAEMLSGAPTKTEQMELLAQMEGTLEDVKAAVERLRKSGRISYAEASTVITNWKRREHRRIARQLEHAPVNLECYNCRKMGHVLADCKAKKRKLVEGAGICFKCGSLEHDIYKCPKKDKIKGFPHANCFICGQVGHLSRDCEKNEHGIYMKGGCCDLCGSKMHLRKDCNKQALKIEKKEDGEEETEEGEEDKVKKEAKEEEDAGSDEGDTEKVVKKAAKAAAVPKPAQQHVTGDDDDFEFAAGDEGDEDVGESTQPPPKKKKKFYKKPRI